MTEYVEKKNKTLTERALRVVNCVDQIFWETGGLPSYEVIAKQTGESLAYVKGVMEKNAVAKRALHVRGVDMNPDVSAQLLNSEQLMCANVVLNAHDKRSQREKLDFLGVSSQQWHAWLRQPAFANYLTKRAEAAFNSNDHAAYAALSENISDNNMDAVKFHFEMRGKYRNQVDVNINVEQIVMNIVDIIATHVEDPEIIMAIASDIQRKALSGGEEEIIQELALPVALPSQVSGF